MDLKAICVINFFKHSTSQSTGNR